MLYFSILLLASNFRVSFSADVVIGPKFKIFPDVGGKFYASREKLYGQPYAFVIPKSSPLKAS